MNLQVDIDSSTAEPTPDEDDLRRWIRAALGERRLDTECAAQPLGPCTAASRPARS